MPARFPDLPMAPPGRTAQRLTWEHLPPYVRAIVEEREGARVVAAASAGDGFTPGFASTLELGDGRRLFVKAASIAAQRPFAEPLREETRKLAALPAHLPAPTLRWSFEDDRWVVLGMGHLPGRRPARPWRVLELHTVLASFEQIASIDASSLAVELPDFATDFDTAEADWDYVRKSRLRTPVGDHLDEVANLAAGATAASAGRALVHTDARDDNILVAGDRAYLCDWNWTVRGAPWIDTVCLLISAYGDGLDADALLRERPLTRDVDPHQVDALLALLTGYFLRARDQVVPPSSPYIRVHQNWYAEVTWAWLAERRGWR